MALGSAEPTAVTCRMGVIITHRTSRLSSLAGVVLALPPRCSLGGLRMRARARRELREGRRGALWQSPEPQLLPSTQVNQRDFESEKRLRKDLKRTKALLADAQIMLDHLKNNAPSKREIAQLKNQVPAERTWSALRATGPASPVLSLASLSVGLESMGRKVTGKREKPLGTALHPGVSA